MIGDGKTPLKVAGNPFLCGRADAAASVRLDDLGGHVAIDKGLAKLQEIGGKSPDGEVALEGEVTLRDPLPTSTVNAYLRFKLTDAFLKQAATVQTILQMAGAQGKRPDGFYGMRLSGRLGQLNPPVLSPTSPITARTAAAARDARRDDARTAAVATRPRRRSPPPPRRRLPTARRRAAPPPPPPEPPRLRRRRRRLRRPRPSRPPPPPAPPPQPPAGTLPCRRRRRRPSPTRSPAAPPGERHRRSRARPRRRRPPRAERAATSSRSRCAVAPRAGV